MKPLTINLIFKKSIRSNAEAVLFLLKVRRDLRGTNKTDTFIISLLFPSLKPVLYVKTKYMHRSNKKQITLFCFISELLQKNVNAAFSVGIAPAFRTCMQFLKYTVNLTNKRNLYRYTIQHALRLKVDIY